jgi:hypothetical protein
VAEDCWCRTADGDYLRIVEYVMDTEVVGRDVKDNLQIEILLAIEGKAGEASRGGARI